MEPLNNFGLKSLLFILIGNSLLLAVSLALPGNVVAVAGTALVVTLVAWIGVRQVGAAAIEESAAAGLLEASRRRDRDLAEAKAQAKAEALAAPAAPSTDAAVQLLALLQREGRLIDFLQEDIAPYDDAQIGAAVRSVHEGCVKALREHVALEPVVAQPEGAPITLEPGFDASAIRVTGNAIGAPPFRGEVRHKGWRVARLTLPTRMNEQDRIVAAAEVEVA